MSAKSSIVDVDCRAIVQTGFTTQKKESLSQEERNRAAECYVQVNDFSSAYEILNKKDGKIL